MLDIKRRKSWKDEKMGKGENFKEKKGGSAIRNRMTEIAGSRGDGGIPSCLLCLDGKRNERARMGEVGDFRKTMRERDFGRR